VRQQGRGVRRRYQPRAADAGSTPQRTVRGAGARRAPRAAAKEAAPKAAWGAARGGAGHLGELGLRAVLRHVADLAHHVAERDRAHALAGAARDLRSAPRRMSAEGEGLTWGVRREARRGVCVCVCGKGEGARAAHNVVDEDLATRLGVLVHREGEPDRHLQDTRGLAGYSARAGSAQTPRFRGGGGGGWRPAAAR
jgi:hypothetical protein